jgi:superoxide reductase
MASKQLQVFQCHKDGFVEVLAGAPCDDISCCGEPMKLLDEKTADSATEKHVPVIQDVLEGTKVTVGSVPHPMEEKHYIMVIELLDGDMLYRKYLKPGDPPEAVFPVKVANPVARELCNIHGLWKG